MMMEARKGNARWEGYRKEWDVKTRVGYIFCLVTMHGAHVGGYVKLGLFLFVN